MERTFLEKLTETVEANLRNTAFGTEELADEMGLSYSSLRRKYFALTGKSLKHFIQGIRLNKALELLRDESLTVAEVSSLSGFNSPNYFSKIFHKNFGMTPGDWRKSGLGVPLADFDDQAKSGKSEGSIRAPERSRRARGLRGSLLAGMAVVLLAAGVFIILNSSGRAREEKSMAVLPFKNLSCDTLDIAFCDGLWNQVIIALEKIKVFNVRSGVSSNQFRDTAISIPEIGRKLGADFIIEGSVDKEGDQVKVCVELIEAKTNKRFGLDEYSFKLGDTFIQLNEIAQHIAYRLNTIVQPEEKAAIDQKCTKSAEAWYNFIKAEHLTGAERGGDPSWALPYRRKTIEFDSTWADAYVRLSQTLLSMYRGNPLQEYLAESLAAAEKAHSLKPGPVTWMQLTDHYLAAGNMKMAKDYFKNVKNGSLDDYYMNFKLGRACRVFGMWKESEDRLLRVYNKYPKSVQNNFILGQTYELLRDFPKAENYYHQGIAVNPPFALNYFGLSDIALRSKGDTGSAREIIQNAHQANPWIDDNLMQAYYQFTMIDIYEGHYDEALKELSRWFYPALRWAPPYYFRPKFLLYSWVYGYLDKPDLELAYFDSTRQFVEAEMIKFPKYQRDPAAYSCLGMAYAGMNNINKALEMADKASGMLEEDPNGFLGPFIMEDIAWIQARTGNSRKALKIIDKLLSEPGPLTVKLLEMDPKWLPLKNYPKFKRIIRHYSL